MEADYSFCENGLLLGICTQFVLNFLLDFLHRLERPELLHHFFQWSEFLIGAYFGHDDRIVLGLTGIPSDDDDFLRVGWCT